MTSPYEFGDRVKVVEPLSMFKGTRGVIATVFNPNPPITYEVHLDTGEEIVFRHEHLEKEDVG